MAYTDPTTRTETEVRGTVTDDLGHSQANWRSDYGPRRVETRRSFMTSEFWVMLVATTGVIVAG